MNSQKDPRVLWREICDFISVPNAGGTEWPLLLAKGPSIVNASFQLLQKRAGKKAKKRAGFNFRD